MEEADLTKIKYYPDRFYICLDGFDIDNLTSFITDLTISQHQSIFIHEYYHYITNIASLPGIRQFVLNFCDRFSATTILTVAEGINAFPIDSNTYPSCKPMVDYWLNAMSILEQDDIDYRVVDAVESSQTKKFTVGSIKKVALPMSVEIEGKTIFGERHFISVHTNDLLDIKTFNLTFGAIDEFLSSSIDEFLFANDLSDLDPSLLSKRPFYPYCFFDELLRYYGISRATAFEKILICYFALNSSNPPVTLINILEKFKNDGYLAFQSNPEKYLLDNFSEAPEYSEILKTIKRLADQTFEQGRIHISQALKYYYDKFYLAHKLKEDDFFYFIRPFFVKEDSVFKMRQQFLLALSRILNLFTPPVILKDKQFFYVDKLTTFGESTMLILAIYEILESIKTNRIAKRPTYLKAKYAFPDGDPDGDNFQKFTPPPIYGTVFRLALNEIGLYKIYLDELDRQKNSQ